MNTTRKLLARSTVAGLIAALALMVGPARAEGAVGGHDGNPDTTFGLASLSFEKSRVDARAGVVDTLTWTVTNSDPTAAGIVGDLTIRTRGPQGTFIGMPIDIPFSFGDSGFSWEGSFVSGTPQRSTYTFDFPVPQYAFASSATWAVTDISLRWDTHTFSGPVSSLGDFKNEVTAKELVDTTPPVYSGLNFAFNLTFLRHPYGFVGPGGGADIMYDIDLQDWGAGVWKGDLLFTGPTGQTVDAPFEVIGPNAFTSGYSCDGGGSGDGNEISCDVNTHFPAGSAPGVWRVTRVTVVDNAGVTAVDNAPQTDSVTLTTDSPLSATGFTLTPNPFNNWASDVNAQVTMTVTGAVGGVSAIYLEDNGQTSCTQLDPTPIANADGTYSASIDVSERQPRCTIGGIAVVDGAGNVAVYGTEYNLPALGLTATQVPDLGPIATGASLSPSTIAAADIFGTPIELTVDVQADTAPVTTLEGVLFDSNGNALNSFTGGSTVVGSGPMTVDLFLPNNSAPGTTYTVGFMIGDAGQKTRFYGFPTHGDPVPGGPLVVTVTG